jgi:hypothetical protein
MSPNLATCSAHFILLYFFTLMVDFYKKKYGSRKACIWLSPLRRNIPYWSFSANIVTLCDLLYWVAQYPIHYKQQTYLFYVFLDIWLKDRYNINRFPIFLAIIFHFLFFLLSLTLTPCCSSIWKLISFTPTIAYSYYIRPSIYSLCRGTVSVPALWVNLIFIWFLCSCYYINTEWLSVWNWRCISAFGCADKSNAP